MQIVDSKTSLNEINKLAQATFGNLVKAVVDVEKEIMVVGGDLHADGESLLYFGNQTRGVDNKKQGKKLFR